MQVHAEGRGYQGSCDTKCSLPPEKSTGTKLLQRTVYRKEYLLKITAFQTLEKETSFVYLCSEGSTPGAAKSEEESSGGVLGKDAMKIAKDVAGNYSR